MSRKILPAPVVLAAAATLAACSASSPPSASAPAFASAAGVASPQAAAAAPSAALHDKQLAALDAMKRAVEARDAHALAALYTDDAVVVPYGGRARHGRADIEQGEARELAPAASVRATPARIWLKGDVAIADWHFRAALAQPARAREVGTTELAILWFAPDGRVREEHDYMNQGTLDMQADGEEHAPAPPDVPATSDVHDGPADDARAVAWTHRYEDACSNDDAAAISMMDEHITWRCTLGFQAESREPFPGVLAHWRAAFPDMHWTADHVWPVEDFVVVEETMTGTHKGKLGPFDGSGRPVTWHWAEVWQLKDGRIAHGWSYASFRELRAQVQPSSEPAPAARADVPCSAEP